jgi:hypothetical protein
VGTIIGFILILISAVAKSVMDKLQFHYGRSIFLKFKNQQFWNPEISWKNKWKNGDKLQGESFFLSSTVLVFTTDAWHLFQNIFLNSLFLGLFFITFKEISWLKALLFLLSRVIFGLTFTYVYTYKLNK